MQQKDGYFQYFVNYFSLSFQIFYFKFETAEKIKCFVASASDSMTWP